MRFLILFTSRAVRSHNLCKNRTERAERKILRLNRENSENRTNQSQNRLLAQSCFTQLHIITVQKTTVFVIALGNPISFVEAAWRTRVMMYWFHFWFKCTPKTKTSILHENEISKCLAAIKRKTWIATRECGLKINLFASYRTCYLNQHEHFHSIRMETNEMKMHRDIVHLYRTWFNIVAVSLSSAWILNYGFKGQPYCLLIFDVCANFCYVYPFVFDTVGLNCLGHMSSHTDFYEIETQTIFNENFQNERTTSILPTVSILKNNILMSIFHEYFNYSA